MAMSKNEVQTLLDDLRVKHNVVGATVGVLKDGAIEACGSGLINLNTRVECTPDSIFQIGSIGKPFTATLIMQLVDEGRLTLDDPVIKHVTDFALADTAAAESVTVRQLLNHTSGIDGDFFPHDDPEGPSTVSYVRKMCLLTNLYAPGKGPMTYSNSAYVVAGRIIEVLTGMTWQRAVMERICVPLGMPAAFAHPEHGLRYRCAIGHVPDPINSSVALVAPDPYLPISSAAAGSVLSMSAESLLLFAKAHMADGAYGEGRILSAQAARRMREEKIALPPLSRSGVTHWGLGWFLAELPDYRMAGHDGETLGQFTYLRTFPERGIAFCLLTNSLSGKMFREFELELMSRLLGTSTPPETPAEPFDFESSKYVGCYRNVGATYEVKFEGGKLVLRFTALVGTISQFQEVLEPYCRDAFELKRIGLKICFIFEQGRNQASFIRMGIIMARRNADFVCD